MNEQLKQSKFDWDKPQETKPRENPPSVIWGNTHDQVEGVVKRLDEVGTDNRMLAEIDDITEGMLTVWLSTVLVNQFSRQGIEVGTYVGIKYLGKPDGKNYHNFDVRVL